MKKNLLFGFFGALLFVFAGLFSANAQVTSSAINGIVTDASGSLPGVTVVATHNPTGTKYATSTREDGRYNFPNVAVGGPYTITASFIGYRETTLENINLVLGENRRIDLVMVPSAVQLGTVEVSGIQDKLFNSSRNGTQTNISQQQIQNLPSLSRSLSDYTRLTPQSVQVGAGTSIGGANNRFNNISIDGAVNNDVFGLAASGTPGGQTGVEPISLEAIDQIQVVIAPYDVRQGGFTGGGVNAITKSGSNKTSVAAFFYGRNQEFAGVTPTNDPTAQLLKLDNFQDYQTGFGIGAPIVKNKAFFYVNAELTRRRNPLGFIPGTSSSNITLSEINSITQLANSFGYDPGSAAGFTNRNNSQKIFGRIDWNLDDKNRLTLRHNYIKGISESGSQSTNAFTFANGGIFFPSITNASVLELKTQISNSASNNLLLTYTTIDDDRDPFGNPFPRVRLNLNYGGTNRSVFLGGEEFSVANKLDQTILELTNNTTLYKGKHTLTFGTHNEFYKFKNLFIRENFGNYTYNLSSEADINNVPNIRPQSYALSYSLVGEQQFAPEFRALQLGFYIQDEWEVNDRVKLNLGVRADIPIFLDNPASNGFFNFQFGSFGVATERVPKAKILASPRVGFNWDMNGDRTTQVRGGAGIFTGRVPYVWVANQYNNTGIEYARLFVSGNNVPANFRFNPDPFNQPKAEDLGLATATSEINVTDENFKFPQNFRANLAVDRKLFWGINGTLEGIFTKAINAVDYKDLNLQDPQTNLTGADNRPLHPFTGGGTRNRVSRTSNYTNVILLTNTNKGYSYSFTASFDKPFENGFTAFAAYTIGESFDVAQTTSSQAVSNWRFTPNVNGLNNLELARSTFDYRHKVTSALTYSVSYAKNFATTISLFYSGLSGQPFSYIYQGDLNKEDLSANTSNDLIYIPRNAGEINFVQNGSLTPADQWAALDAFITSDEYLNSRRGQYAERNGARTPWNHQIDLRLMQDIKIQSGTMQNKLQITFDVFNVANLLNKKWGRQFFVSNQTAQVIRHAGFLAGTNTPTFTFTPINNAQTDNKPWNASNLGSRWQAQLGLRYSF